MSFLNQEAQSRLTGNIGYVHQFLGPKLSKMNLLWHVHLGLFSGVTLLTTIDNGKAEPLRIHGCQEAEEEPLFRFSVTLTTPSIRHIPFELVDVLDLFPHIGNGELRSLRHFHLGHLERPEDILLSGENLVEEVDGAVLFLW